MNKFSKFIIQDSEVSAVKYLSFAGKENTPLEYYYNCSRVNRYELGSMPVYKSMKNLISPLSEVFNKTRGTTLQSMKEMMKVEQITALNLTISVMNLFIFSILIISLYCVYIYSERETDV